MHSTYTVSRSRNWVRRWSTKSKLTKSNLSSSLVCITPYVTAQGLKSVRNMNIIPNMLLSYALIKQILLNSSSNDDSRSLPVAATSSSRYLPSLSHFSSSSLRAASADVTSSAMTSVSSHSSSWSSSADSCSHTTTRQSTLSPTVFFT